MTTYQEEEAIRSAKRQAETDKFFAWREEMVKANPIPFTEDTRHYKERESDMKRFFENKIIVEYYESKRGGYSWEYNHGSGLIEEITEGVWGYGGDAIAVKINGDYYPSSQVRAKP